LLPVPDSTAVFSSVAHARPSNQANRRFASARSLPTQTSDLGLGSLVFRLGFARGVSPANCPLFKRPPGTVRWPRLCYPMAVRKRLVGKTHQRASQRRAAPRPSSSRSVVLWWAWRWGRVGSVCMQASQRRHEVRMSVWLAFERSAGDRPCRGLVCCSELRRVGQAPGRPIFVGG
jgi:hypothetical protein